jgi:TrmH family RNA methyltransferase
MLSKAQEKLIRSLHTKKGREKSGLCLVEGKKVIETAKEAVDFTFTPQDSDIFRQLVTTETPQDMAGVAKIPEWTRKDITQQSVIVVLDGVQDPGNIGSILRLCLGFNASLLLIDSVDVTNPKVIRSSVGAIFQVPWINISRSEAEKILTSLDRPIYRLEKVAESIEPNQISDDTFILIAGSEGSGIQLPIDGIAVSINHDPRLESLNVAHALAIALYETSNRR